MALSSGVRRALGEGTIWLGVAAWVGAGMYYFDDLQAYWAAHKAASIASTEASAPASQTAAASKRREASDHAAPDSGQTVKLRADNSGHFNTTAYVNGAPVKVLVDTGATYVALTWDDARSAGIHMRESDFKHAVSTANGITYVASVKLDNVRINNIDIGGVQAFVHRPGQLHVTLLGMSFLGKLSLQIKGRDLVLSQ